MAKKKNLGLLLPFRSLLPALLVLAALLLDTTILPAFYNGIFAPNFTMALILAFAIRSSTAMGFAYGVTAGLLLDISTSYPVGLYTATFLIAVLVASMCAFFERNTGKMIILTLIYLIQELVFLIIAYASTIRMEWAYFLPLLARVVIGVVLCALLQLFVAKYLRPRGVEYTRSRRQ